MTLNELQEQIEGIHELCIQRRISPFDVGVDIKDTTMGDGEKTASCITFNPDSLFPKIVISDN